MGSYEGLKRMPMFRLLIPFILGIIIQNNIEVSLLFIVPASLIFFMLICIIWKYEQVNPAFRGLWHYGLVLNLFVLIVSMGLMHSRMHSSSFIDYSQQDSFISAIIIESPEERNNSYRVIIESDGILSGDSIINISERAVAWMEKDSSAALLRAGDRIVFTGLLREIINPGNPFEFNYRRYMNLQGVSGEIYLPGDSWFRIDGKNRDRGIKLRQNALRLRDNLLDRLISSGIGEQEYSVAAALLLGYKSALDHETRQLYAGAGAMHILAVSGLHVGILYILLVRILGVFRNTKYYYTLSTLIIILIIWFYAFLTGLSPSVTRSATMFTFLAIASKMGRSTTALNTIASAALVQLLLDPYSLFMVGFQLSYLAVAGIVYYQPLFYSFFRFSNYVSDKIWALCTVSFSAQIFIFPLCIYYFNQFPNYFLLTNIVAVPLAMMILYSGFFFFLLSGIPLLADGLAFVLNAALKCLNFITGTVSHLPLSQTTDIVVSLQLLLILYGIIFTTIMFLVVKKIRFLQFSILLIIVALILRADHIISTEHQNIFIIYNERNSSLYNFISGNESIIVASDPEIHETATMPYAASRPALHLNTGKASILSAGDFFNSDLSGKYFPGHITGNFVSFAGRRIYFAFPAETKNLKMQKPVRVDILVIAARPSMTMNLIGSAVIPGTVVIDSSVSYGEKIKIIEYCREKEFKYHDVNDSGAFVVEM